MTAHLDFELEIGAGAGREYPCAVLRAPGGEARAVVRLPFNARRFKAQAIVLSPAPHQAAAAAFVHRRPGL
jgi:hypothetical protein